MSDIDRILHFCTGKPLILHTRNNDLTAAIFIVFDFYAFCNDMLLVRCIKTADRQIFQPMLVFDFRLRRKKVGL